MFVSMAVQEKKDNKRSIKTQILELLDDEGPMRFSAIVRALKKADMVISRELKNLQKDEPPLILKSQDKLYSINYDNPRIMDLLMSYSIIPRRAEIYPVVRVVDKEKDNVAFMVQVVATREEGLNADLCALFESDEVSQILACLYKEVLYTKLLRILKNKKTLPDSGDILKEWNEVVKEGIEIHIVPDRGSWWGHHLKRRSKHYMMKIEKAKNETKLTYSDE